MEEEASSDSKAPPDSSSGEYVFGYGELVVRFYEWTEPPSLVDQAADSVARMLMDECHCTHWDMDSRENWYQYFVEADLLGYDGLLPQELVDMVIAIGNEYMNGDCECHKEIRQAALDREMKWLYG